MPKVQCQHCYTKFSRVSDLNRHMKHAKYCRQLRGAEADQDPLRCNYCGKIFSRKDSRIRHQMDSCVASPRDNTIYNELMEQISDLKRKISDMQETDTNNGRVVVNNLAPLTDKAIKDQAENLTLDFILEGGKGFADFANYYPFKDRVLCTDRARKKFRYKDTEGKLVSDGGGLKLTQKFFQSIAIKNEELITAEYAILQKEVAKIADAGTAATSDLTEILTKATRLQDLLLLCKDAAEGKTNELTHEFLKHYSRLCQ